MRSPGIPYVFQSDCITLIRAMCNTDVGEKLYQECWASNIFSS